MSGKIDDSIKRGLFEGRFKTYAEYMEAARCLNAVRYFLHLDEIIKIIKLDGFNSEHFKDHFESNFKFYPRYRLGIDSRPPEDFGNN